MAETWLRQNTRALTMAMLIPGIVTLVLLTWLAGIVVASPSGWARLGLYLLAAGSACLFLALAWEIRQPRLAYGNGRMLVHLRRGVPISVPIEIVEGFLLGQGPTMLPGKKYQRAETRTLVIRLADRADEWSHLDVKPALGKWCDGYITIRGTWCEPIHLELVNRLNARLAEVQQQFAQHGQPR